MKKIFFIDSKTNLSKIKFSKKDIWISFDIESYVNLKKKNKNVQYFVSYLDKKGHYYIAKNTKKILDKLETFNFVDKNGLSKSYSINFERKVYFFLTNYFFLKYIFQKIFTKYNKNFKIVNNLTDKFNTFKDINSQNNFFSFFVSNQKQKNITFLEEKKSQNFLEYIIFKITCLFLTNKYLLLYNDDVGLQNYVNFLKKKYNFKKIIFFSNLKINFLKKYLKYKTLTLSVNEKNFYNNKEFKELKKYFHNYNKNFNYLFKTDDIFKFLIKNYINNYIFNFIKNLILSSEKLFEFFLKKKPKVILSRLSSDIGYSIAEISKKLNIDSYIVSHASHILNKNQLSMFDWKLNAKSTINSEFKFIASQSKFSNEFLKKINTKSKIINTGPIILSTPEKNYLNKKKNSVKIILQASTPKNISNFRAINYETTYDYIENIKQQILALKDRQDIFIIIKFREYDFLRLNDFKYLMPKTNNYEIDTTSPLKDLLQRCDYLSSYSSTVIEEALFFGKDIILYDRNDIYKHLSKLNYRINKKKISKIYYINHSSNLKKIFN